jgi:nucleoside-diphosphate-sugar epimerase
MINNLVLGSEGFIGKVFCRYLESLGESVVKFDIKRGEQEDGRFVKIDFSNVDRVYFLAWDVGGAKYLYKQEAQLHQLEWNLLLMTNLMPQLQEAKKPFLFISSQLAEEYDTVYGVTKRLGEVWTRLLDGVFIREWNVYGPLEGHSERSHVISDFIHQALTTKEIRMMTNGEELRQFIYIDDVCEAWHMALDQNLKGIHDVTSFEWVRILDVANIIADLTGAKVITGEKAGSTPITPIKGKIPGWFPKIKLEDGLKKMIADFSNKI